MGTYQARVEDYVGTVADTTALGDQLTAGAKLISDVLPLPKLEPYGTDLTDSGTGVAITGYRVLGAHKSNYEANFISADMKARAADSGSIHYANARSPSAYITGGKIYVIPSGGTIRAYAYPTVTYSASTISGFPTESDQGVVLYTAIQQCSGKLNVAMDALNGLSYVPPTTAPTNPSTFTASADIATALGLINTQVDSGVTGIATINTQLGNAVTRITTANTEIGLANIEIDKMAAEVVLADAETAKAIIEIGLSNTEADKLAAEIASAKTELSEAVTNVDIPLDTATTAITTASGRINTAVGLANAEFDKIAAIIDLANVEFDLVNTDIDTGSTTITTDEDIELGLAQADIAMKRVQNGQSYIEEAKERYNNGMAYLQEAQAGFTEAQSYSAEINGRVAQIQAQLNIANGYFSAAQNFGLAGDKYIQTSQGYIQTSQAYISSARAYGETAQGYLGTATAYLQEIGKDIEIALGYAKVVDSYLGAAQGYATEAQMRLTVDVQTYQQKLERYKLENEEYLAQMQNAQTKYNLDQERLTKQINHYQLLLTSLNKQLEDFINVVKVVT